jgi:VanZ family protein
LSDFDRSVKMTDLPAVRQPSPVPGGRQGNLLWAWLPAIVWLAIIAVESTDLLSSEHTSRFLFPVMHWLFGVTAEQFAPFHAVLRKLGHVFGYGMLSLLLYRAWRSSIAVAGHPRWSMKWSRLAIFMTAMVASLDEWHQSYLPSRIGTVHDVFLDTAAALAAQLGLYLVLRKRGSPRAM